ncbi:MAG: NAD-dependent epimerase/dehydratase family protein [Gammaproteobacteria bacterium]
MSHPPMRALVTGSNGFLGRHLADLLLAQGHDVHGVVRPRPAVSVAARPAHAVTVLDFAAADTLDTLLAEYRPSHVFHCAGSLRTPGLDAASLITANVTVTEQLLAALARCAAAPVVVVPASAAVYGRPQALPIDEDHPIAPLDLYGVSKAAQELVLEQHHRAWGCPIRILRVFNVVGPGQPPTLVAASMARQIALVERGERARVEVGNLSSARDLVDVRDVARACVGAAQLDAGRIVLNVCSGRATPMEDCLAALREAARVPFDVVRSATLLRPNDVPEHRGDPARIAAVLGWQPAIAFADSMRDLLVDWRARVAG